MRHLRKLIVVLALLAFCAGQSGVSFDSENSALNTRECLEPGDMNLDGDINILDIVLLVGCIMGTQLTNCECGDVNFDGIWNIMDIMALLPPLIPMSVPN